MADDVAVVEVEAYVASWIEITAIICCYVSSVVEAYVASWIEMSESS